MRPLLHPTLVNGRFGDPALYIETLFEKHAILFDLGDISALSPRNVLRVEHVFVSHAHVDHFIGFDRLLRLSVGREKEINLYGPVGFIDQVGHKLHAYQWNLGPTYACDLIFVVTEIDASLATRCARFQLKRAFAAEDMGDGHLIDATVRDESTFRISTVVLDHRIPCLAFAIEEAQHANVWRNRLVERGLAVGSWLRDLKRAVVAGRPDDFPITLGTATTAPLGTLRDLVTVTPGQKIAYATDVANTPDNRAAIAALARGADLLFIEAAFAKADAALAAERAHLTTAAAGEIARAAGVRRLEPFHFSARYDGEEERMVAEVMAAFGSGDVR
ncbi:MAG TPA: MBL fold metallo-hydrolase [Xanthobacteraceae bacterium]|jgi:ribonuclease Z